MRETTMRHLTRDQRPREQGQALVVFVLALVAIIAVTGLVLDGGSAFSQRRQEQNVADLAVMGAAIAHANTPGDYFARQFAGVTRGHEVAADNGYVTGVASTNVAVASVPIGSSGVRYTVTVTRPHRNNFAGLLGQPSWNVSATATAVAGIPNAAMGAMPIIFNQKVFQKTPDHDPNALEEYSEPGTGPEDVPQDATSFNWTVYCLANGLGAGCNANSRLVSDLINQYGYDTVVDLNDDIGPLNAGTHTTLFGDMERWRSYEFPVSIVDDEGNMLGWAIFHLVETQGASRKVLTGYFVGGINAAALTLSSGGGSGNNFGAYTVKLVV
jgi:Flp pilus assembly protein TadG